MATYTSNTTDDQEAAITAAREFDSQNPPLDAEGNPVVWADNAAYMAYVQTQQIASYARMYGIDLT